MATRVFSDAELEALRGFPEITSTSAPPTPALSPRPRAGTSADPSPPLQNPSNTPSCSKPRAAPSARSHRKPESPRRHCTATSPHSWREDPAAITPTDDQTAGAANVVLGYPLNRSRAVARPDPSRGIFVGNPRRQASHQHPLGAGVSHRVWSVPQRADRGEWA